MVPTRPTTQAVRRNRSASTYSGPSGHAATMSTSDPNSTAIPRIDSTRPSQIDPLDTVLRRRCRCWTSSRPGGRGRGSGRRRVAGGRRRRVDREAEAPALVGGAVGVGGGVADVAVLLGDGCRPPARSPRCLRPATVPSVTTLPPHARLTIVPVAGGVLEREHELRRRLVDGRVGGRCRLLQRVVGAGDAARAGEQADGDHERDEQRPTSRRERAPGGLGASGSCGHQRPT